MSTRERVTGARLCSGRPHLFPAPERSDALATATAIRLPSLAHALQLHHHFGNRFTRDALVALGDPHVAQTGHSRAVQRQLAQPSATSSEPQRIDAAPAAAARAAVDQAVRWHFAL